MSEDSMLEAIQAIARKFDDLKKDIEMLKCDREQTLGLPNCSQEVLAANLLLGPGTARRAMGLREARTPQATARVQVQQMRRRAIATNITTRTKKLNGCWVAPT